MNYYTHYIEKLEDNEVFVFGSNKQGFHGAGSAGYASFGEKGNVWRKYEYDKKPNGWKGKWNVKGIGEGFQEGLEGKSYALPTVIKAGAKASLTLDQIKENVSKLYSFAYQNSQYKFYIALRDDARHLNGYQFEDLIWCYHFHKFIPSNIIFHWSVYKEIYGANN